MPHRRTLLSAIKEAVRVVAHARFQVEDREYFEGRSDAWSEDLAALDEAIRDLEVITFPPKGIRYIRVSNELTGARREAKAALELLATIDTPHARKHEQWIEVLLAEARPGARPTKRCLELARAMLDGLAHDDEKLELAQLVKEMGEAEPPTDIGEAS